MRAFGTLAAVLVVVGCSAGSKSAVCTGPACTSGTPCKGSRDCSSDAGFSCVNSVCSQSCFPDGGGCANDQLCRTVSGHPVCLEPCVGGTCTAGAGCQMDWATHTPVCAGAPPGGACKSVVVDSACTACGPQLFTTVCDNGFLCPSGSACDLLDGPHGRCVCDPGSQTVDCAGQVCDDGFTDTCIPGQYSCRPESLPILGCYDEPLTGSGHCVCADGRALPFACGATSSCEFLCSLGCDFTRQDCQDPTTPRCTLASDVSVATVPLSVAIDRVECTPLLGSHKLAEACTFVALSDGGEASGRDDCDKGLLCSHTGLPRGEQHCRKLCAANADCSSTETCLRAGVTSPPIGFCLEVGSCSIDGPGCDAGQSCVATLNVGGDAALYCKYDGSGVLGAECGASGCGANLSCVGSCLATCSGQHSCDAGSCAVFGSDPNGPGLCE